MIWAASMCSPLRALDRLGLRPPRRKATRWKLLALSGAVSAHNATFNGF